MKLRNLLTVAVLGGTLLLSGCSDTKTEDGDQPEPRPTAAPSDSGSPAVLPDQLSTDPGTVGDLPAGITREQALQWRQAWNEREDYIVDDGLRRKQTDFICAGLNGNSWVAFMRAEDGSKDVWMDFGVHDGLDVHCQNGLGRVSVANHDFLEGREYAAAFTEVGEK